MSHRPLIVGLLMIVGAASLQGVTYSDSNDNATPTAATATAPSKMIWVDRGPLTPTQIFFGPASEKSQPLDRLPTPPYSNFKPDDQPNKFSPKCYLTDANGVEWTAKFRDESHGDVAAPRLAWALGYGVDETYFVPGGVIEGVTPHTNRGKASQFVSASGVFGEARFKRHPEHHVKDNNGHTAFWDESNNPGVPQQQLDGLKILDVMVFNWDAQPKNCEILKAKDDPDSADWYIMSDWGKTFGYRDGRRLSMWNLADYQKVPFITGVNDNRVAFYYHAAIGREESDHRSIPIADVQWFRTVVDKMTDDDIRAAFNASVATPDLTAAYAAGDVEKANALTSPEINGFVQEFRRRIHELDTKVPASQ